MTAPPGPIHCRIVRASREQSRTLDDLLAALDSIELRPGDRIHLRVDRASYVEARERRSQLYQPSGGASSQDYEDRITRRMGGQWNRDRMELRGDDR